MAALTARRSRMPVPLTRAELLPLTLELDQLKIDVIQLADAINKVLLSYARIPARGQSELANSFDDELRQLNLTLESTTKDLLELSGLLDVMREADW